MSENHIKENFKLSADFNSYLMDHPEMVDEIPKNAHIVMGDSGNSYLTKKNYKIFENERGDYYQAIKKGRKWEIKKIGEKVRKR